MLDARSQPSGLVKAALTGEEVIIASSAQYHQSVLGVLNGEIGRGIPLITTGWMAALRRLNPVDCLCVAADQGQDEQQDEQMERGRGQPAQPGGCGGRGGGRS
jgi:hypothetical protein